MNTSDARPNDDELLDLFEDFLADTLTPERFEQLQRRLRDDTQVRRDFVRYCHLQTDLHLHMRAKRSSDRVLRQLPPRLAETAPPPAKTTRRWSRFVPRFGPRRSYLGWLAASLLLGGASLVWWHTRPVATSTATMEPMTLEVRTDPEIAWLINAQNCKWADHSEPTDGIRSGTRLRIDNGLAELQFRKGVRIVLEGPADLECLHENAARLHRGKLTARVPESASGFTVLAPEGKVIDHGTEFGVSVGLDGSTAVRVFEGRVEAISAQKSVDLRQEQSARLENGDIQPLEPTQTKFVREIVPPALPQTTRFDFSKIHSGTLTDKNGRGIGLTHRLPGTGTDLPGNDPNLELDPERGRLLLTTTNSDINRQVNMPTGEYLGVRLSELGFTGSEDFAIMVEMPKIPALESIGQFGLYAGARSDSNIRGGLIGRKELGQYTIFMVNNRQGQDQDSHWLGLHHTGDDMRMTLRRVDGKYSLTVENLTTGNSSTLTVRHPEFLDREKDLYVGLFGANTRSEVRRTLIIKELAVTIWKIPRKG